MPSHRQPCSRVRVALLIAGSALATIPFATQHASAAESVTRFGSTRAQDCFHAADAHRPSREGIATCDAALSEDLLSKADRAATLVNRGPMSILTNC